MVTVAPQRRGVISTRSPADDEGRALEFRACGRIQLQNGQLARFCIPKKRRQVALQLQDLRDDCRLFFLGLNGRLVWV